MPAFLLPLAIAAAGSAIGGALSNKKSARTGTQSNTTTTTFNEPAEYRTLGDLLRSRIENRLRSSVDLGGYEAQGLTGINDAFAGAQTALNADLTSRGLATSPIAATAGTNLQAERGTNIAQFLNQLPLLRRQMEGEDLNAANAFYQARPRGTTVSQHGTQIVPGSAAGSAFGSAAEMLAFFAGQGLFKGGGTAPTFPNIH